MTALSVYDDGYYHLAIVRRGRLRRLPVVRSGTPFDADVGPDTRGRPVVVFSRRDRLYIHRLRGRRYHIGADRYEWERDYLGVSGYALVPGGAALVLDAGDDEVGDDPNESPDARELLCSIDPGGRCRLLRVSPRWEPIPAGSVQR